MDAVHKSMRKRSTPYSDALTKLIIENPDFIIAELIKHHGVEYVIDLLQDAIKERSK